MAKCPPSEVYNRIVIKNGGTVTISGGAAIVLGGGADSGVFVQNASGSVRPNSIIATPLVLISPATTFAVSTDISRTLTISGGITGTSDLTLHLVGTNSHLLIQTGSINITGSITTTGNSGGTAPDIIISAVIGPNVTAFVHAIVGPNPDPLTLSGANTFSGPTTITAGSGEFRLGHADALQNSTVTVSQSVTTNQGLKFLPGIGTFTVGGLAGASNFVLADNDVAPAPITLQVGNNDADTTYTGVMSGAGGLTKIGSGVLTLTNSSSYTGATVVDGGTLRVNGALTATSSLTVNAGGTLAGTGTITSSVTIDAGGTHAPGNSPGIQAIVGSYTLNNAATLVMEIAGPGAGVGYDQVAVTGSVTIDGANLVLNILKPFAFSPDDQIVLINNDGADAVSGSYFAGLGEGGLVYYDSHAFARISYVGGTGNDVVLTVLPEPTSLAVCLVAAAIAHRPTRRRST